MKLKKTINIILLVLVMGLFSVAVLLFRHLELFAWSVRTDNGFSRLSQCIQVYHSQFNKYPSSIEELRAAKPEGGRIKYAPEEIFNDTFGDVWDYWPDNNGFHISVTKTRGIFGKGECREKIYENGEALNR